MNVSIKIQGIEKVKKYLFNLPKGLNDVVTKTIADYLLGENAGDVAELGLRGYDPYKFVKRKTAYGAVSKDGAPDGYFSWKQFRYVAWKTKGFTENMGSSSNRTGESGKAWTVSKIPLGYELRNASSGMIYARHDELQARQLKKVGWRTVSRIIKHRMAKAYDLVLEAVKQHLAKK